MKKEAIFKRTQVDGKKYDLPEEEITIEKLINKGLGLQSKIEKDKNQLDLIKDQITEIARRRRDGSTTVKMQGISGSSVVTFRESYTCKDNLDEIRQDLGTLFDRFFSKNVEFKTSTDLKQFLEGGHFYGLKDPGPIKKLILSYVQKKETKPNVKLVAAE